MLLASPDELGYVAEDEDEREGEQQLHLVRRAVDPPQQFGLDRGAEQRETRRGADQRGGESR